MTISTTTLFKEKQIPFRWFHDFSYRQTPLLCYTTAMNTSTLEKQFASVAEGRSDIADVRTPRGNLIILSERLGERFRPLLEYMARQISAESVPATETGWTDEKNGRRMELINKKYDGGLTAAEKRELKVLQQDGEQHGDHMAGSRNEILELLVLGLEQKVAQQKTAQ